MIVWVVAGIGHYLLLRDRLGAMTRGGRAVVLLACVLAWPLVACLKGLRPETRR